MTSKEFIANQLKELEATRDYLKSNGKDVKPVNEAIENYKQVLKDLEIQEWLIEKMYVAQGLIELKVCPPNNPTILKYHNGIETHDTRFNNYIDRIHYLKYGR